MRTIFVCDTRLAIVMIAAISRTTAETAAHRTSRRTLSHRTSLIDSQGAAIKVLAIEHFNSGHCSLVCCHLHECETT